MKTAVDETSWNEPRVATGPTSLLQLSASLRCVLAAAVVAGLWLVIGWAIQWW